MTDSTSAEALRGKRKQRFAVRLRGLRDFAYLAMWAGNHVSSMDGASAEGMLAAVEPGIRSSLRSERWLKGKRRLRLSPQTLERARPLFQRRVTETLLIQLDAVVHHTLNDLCGNGAAEKARWFETDAFNALGDHRTSDGQFYLHAESERLRDLVLLALVRNAIVHGEGHPLLVPDRVKGFAKKLLKLGSNPISWGGSAIASSTRTAIDSPERAAAWFAKEQDELAKGLAYDDYFRFTWAAKTILNAMILKA